MTAYTTHIRRLDVRRVLPPPRSKAGVRLMLAAGLLLADLLTLVVSAEIVDFIRGERFTRFDARIIFGLVAPTFLISAFAVRAYSVVILLDWRTSLRQSLMALAITAGAISMFLYALKISEETSRLSIALTFALFGIMAGLLRHWYSRVAGRGLEGSLYSVVELRDGVPAVGSQSHDTSSYFDPLRPNAVSLSALARLIGKADRVVLNCSVEHRTAWTKVFKGMDIRAEIVASEFSCVHPIGIGSHAGMPTMVITSGSSVNLDRALKRLFDLAFSTLALLVLSPFLCAIALAIKLESPGPVFFRQPRIGRQNSLFRLIKFRTMRTAACDVSGISSTCRGDPRLTRLGPFLRRTSIDELPQFINVLLGEMSVVGPRPHAINSMAENRLFWDADDRYWLRHACRPGLTGLAQVRGLRGATACIGDLTARVEADLQYLQKWSLWQDLMIIVRTIRVLANDKAF